MPLANWILSVGRNNRTLLKPILDRLQLGALHSARREQGLDDLAGELARIVPSVEDQYTTVPISSPVMTCKVRSQHAFQVGLALKAIDMALAEATVTKAPFTIVDIGDSSGTHVAYIRRLLATIGKYQGIEVRTLSVNLDSAAVAKIRAKGLDAMLCRAEELHARGVDAGVLLSYEMLEHLNNPVEFLDSISRDVPCGCFAITVPYLRRSRVGLHHVRRGAAGMVTLETTHIFELAPEDWKLLFRHAGWEPVFEEVYLQYPRHSIWRATQPMWRLLDFEGFYGVILKRNRVWADRYSTGAQPTQTPP